MIVFNMIILRYMGNLGVAAYGIIANIALVIHQYLQVFHKECSQLLAQIMARSNMIMFRRF